MNDRIVWQQNAQPRPTNTTYIIERCPAGQEDDPTAWEPIVVSARRDTAADAIRWALTVADSLKHRSVRVREERA